MWIRSSETEMHRLLYPNTSYGYVSGGDPKYITSLSYEKSPPRISASTTLRMRAYSSTGI